MAEARARLEKPSADGLAPVTRLHELEREVVALETAIALTDARARDVRAKEMEGVALHGLSKAFPLVVPALLAVGALWNAPRLAGHPVAAWLVTASTCLEAALVTWRHRPAPRARAFRRRRR